MPAKPEGLRSPNRQFGHYGDTEDTLGDYWEDPKNKELKDAMAVAMRLWDLDCMANITEDLSPWLMGHMEELASLNHKDLAEDFIGEWMAGVRYAVDVERALANPQKTNPQILARLQPMLSLIQEKTDKLRVDAKQKIARQSKASV